MGFPLWGAKEDEILRELFPDSATRDVRAKLAEQGFVRTLDAIEKRARRLQIRKSPVGLRASYDARDATYPGVTPDAQLSDENLQAKRGEIFGLHQTGAPVVGIAKQLGVPADFVRSVLGEQKVLTDQNQRLKKELDHEKDKTSLLVSALNAAMLKYQIEPVKPPKPEKQKTERAQDFFAMISDAQIGQLVVAEHVQGLSSYNFDVFCKRLNRWTQALVKFREQDKAALGLNRLVIKFLGDMVEGERIYKGQPFYLDLNAFDQVFQGAIRIAEAVRTLATVFPEIECYAICGNHGRPGKRGEHHTKTNFDRFFYAFLSMAFRYQPNIKFYTSDGPIMVARHHEHRIAMIHGSEARSWMGIPYYGLDRVERRLHGLFAGLKINLMLCGDKHDPAILHESVIMNGSFVGGSDFSINTLLLNSVPSQRIFYLDPKWGAHRHTSLWLDAPPKVTEDENRILTPYTDFAEQMGDRKEGIP